MKPSTQVIVTFILLVSKAYLAYDWIAYLTH